jgi:hypothetical protein
LVDCLTRVCLVSPALRVLCCRSGADLDGNALIDFTEWLRLFRAQLLDLPRMLRYMKMKPVVSRHDVCWPAAAALVLLALGCMWCCNACR